MKIVYIIPTLSVGGAERLAIQQLNYLFENSFTVYLILLKQTSFRLDDLKIPEDHIFCLNSQFTTLGNQAVLRAPLNTIKLAKLLKQIMPQIVVAHLSLAHFLMRLVHFFYPKIPLTLFHYHHSTQYIANPIDTFTKRIFHSLNKKLGSKIEEKHIFISKAVEEDISNHLNVTVGKVIYNAIVSKPPDLVTAKEWLPTCTHRLWIVPGRLQKSKGQIFLINSVASIQKDHRDIHILLAGDGPDKKEIKSLIRKYDLTDRIILTGFIRNEIMMGLMKQSELVIIPSLEEGLGLAAIEALSLGKPILSSDAGGLSEVIRNGENGFLFKRGNYDSLMAALKPMLDQKPHNLINPESLKHEFREKYDFKVMMNELIDFFQV